VGQVGYITLGLGLGTESGLAAALAHIFNHGVTKGALFLLAGALALRLGDTRFRSLDGAGRTMPVATFAFVLGGLSLIGVPGTAGFASKWALLGATLEAGRPVLAAAIVLSSLLAVAYVWRFVECAYFRAPASGHPAPGEAPAALTVPALALTALVLLAGLHASPVLNAARRGAQALMGAAS
jgi:multicomponent Na+:H+ antiporter subunit D